MHTPEGQVEKGGGKAIIHISRTKEKAWVLTWKQDMGSACSPVTSCGQYICHTASTCLSKTKE